MSSHDPGQMHQGSWINPRRLVAGIVVSSSGLRYALLSVLPHSLLLCIVRFRYLPFHPYWNSFIHLQCLLLFYYLTHLSNLCLFSPHQSSYTLYSTYVQESECHIHSNLFFVRYQNIYRLGEKLNIFGNYVFPEVIFFCKNM